MHLFHKWGKWATYKVKMKSWHKLRDHTEKEFEYEETWQKRECLHCHLLQTRKVYPESSGL